MKKWFGAADSVVCDNISLAFQNPLGRQETFNANRSSGMDASRTDANFSTWGLEVTSIVDYRQFSNIRNTQSQNINVSRLVLQWSLPNPLKPGVKWRMKM